MIEPAKRPCPCCGNLTLEAEVLDDGDFDICLVCFWEDDPAQRDNPVDPVGANDVSLREARENYQVYGASKQSLAPHVRSPRPEELPPKGRA